MVTLRDVAIEAGVSVATVSRSLNGADGVGQRTRERVVAAARRMNYEPNRMARSLRTNKGSMVAVAVTDIEQQWYSRVLKHIQRELNRIPSELMVIDLNRSTEGLYSVLSSASTLGLRAVGFATSDHIYRDELHEAVESCNETGISVFSIGQDFTDIGVHSVVYDDHKDALKAAKAFISAGCRDVVYLGRATRSATGGQRHKGFVSAIHELGFPESDRVVFTRDAIRFEAGYKGMMEALNHFDRIDGVIAASDEMAIGAIAALHDEQISVPDEVSVIGYGGGSEEAIYSTFS